MAEVRPFHGVYYNPAQVKDPGTVICPPYDIISPQMQQELYQRSEYNFVRVEFTREQPGEKDPGNRYRRAAATLEKWLKQGVFQVGSKPALYLHDHHFRYQGGECYRRGIVCLVKLEEWSKMVVRPHEGTLAAPKSDRLSVLGALKANTSPILSLYQDRGKTISALLAEQSRAEPLLSADMGGGEKHVLWAIDDPETIKRISRRLARQPLYIADGHHRYESALAYRHERRAIDSVAGEASFDFVMMNLVDFADPGLVILPAHRLLRGLTRQSLKGLPARLKTVFKVQESPFDTSNMWPQVKNLQAAADNEVKIILVGLKEKHFTVLTLDDFEAVGRMMPYFHSELYKKLEVSIVDHIILDDILGLNHAGSGVLIDYSYDGLDAVNRVLAQEFQLAFIINPVKPEVVKAVADSGERMPKKSTYFFPKAPAGLVFHRFD